MEIEEMRLRAIGIANQSWTSSTEELIQRAEAIYAFLSKDTTRSANQEND